MPTGYTATLCEGEQSFSEFALGCARAMGACVMQRDDPMSDLPKARERDTYHEQQIALAHVELAVLLNLSEEDKLRLGTNKRNERIADYEKQIVEKTAIRGRLSAMIDKVTAWEPPSKDHEGLKSFMLEQLDTTIKHDGDVSYYARALAEAQAKTAIDYYNQEVESAKWSISYHKKEAAKSEERVVDQGQWIADLYESLGKADPEMSALLLKRV